MWIAKVQFSLHTRPVSLGNLVLVNIIFELMILFKWTAKVLIRLHACAGWYGPSLSAYHSKTHLLIAWLVCIHHMEICLLCTPTANAKNSLLYRAVSLSAQDCQYWRTYSSIQKWNMEEPDQTLRMSNQVSYSLGITPVSKYRSISYGISWYVSNDIFLTNLAWEMCVCLYHTFW